jgi:hypothetical protein
LEGAPGLTAAITPSSCQIRSKSWLSARRRVLALPEAGELVEQLLGAVEVGVDRRADALHSLFERLAPHRVLTPGEVAHHVEVLQPLELREQFATAVGWLPGRARASAWIASITS